MKKLKFFLFVFLVAPLAFSACSGDGGGSGNPPNQAMTNLAFQDLVDVSFFVSAVFQGDVQSCADLETALSGLEGTFPCESGGTVIYTLNTFDCVDGPPLSGTFS